MLVKKAVQKTKIFLHKTIQNLSSFLSKKHQKLAKSPSISHPNSTQFDEVFSEQSITKPTKEVINEKNVDFESLKNGVEQIIVKKKHDERGIKRDKKMGSYREDKGEPCSKISRGGGYVLARKMKELEKFETSDVDEVLDIEEVLHYYSCLTSPCYLEIVDKFYIDMHSEFLLPQPSKRFSNSSRRLGPLKI